MNGKGDNPKNCFSKQFRDNYDIIEWRDRGSYCFECGFSIDMNKLKEYSHFFEIFEDGHVRHRNCNFN